MPRKAAEPEKVPPIHKANKRALQMAIWPFEYQGKDGETRLGHNVSLDQNYQDKDGNWQKTRIRLSDREIGDAIALLQNAQQYLVTDKAA